MAENRLRYKSGDVSMRTAGINHAPASDVGHSYYQKCLLVAPTGRGCRASCHWTIAPSPVGAGGPPLVGVCSAPRSHVPFVPRVTPFMSTLKVFVTNAEPFQYWPTLVTEVPGWLTKGSGVTSANPAMVWAVSFTKGLVVADTL